MSKENGQNGNCQRYQFGQFGRIAREMGEVDSPTWKGLFGPEKPLLSTVVIAEVLNVTQEMANPNGLLPTTQQVAEKIGRNYAVTQRHLEAGREMLLWQQKHLNTINNGFKKGGE